MKHPRKLKKAIANSKIIYDILGKPHRCTLEEILDIYKTHGVLFWDSQQGATQPMIIPKSKFLKTINLKNQQHGSKIKIRS